MSTHHVRITEGFSREVALGALIVGNMRDRTVEVIDGPRVRTITHATGDILSFRTKADAMKFCKAHPANAVYAHKI